MKVRKRRYKSGNIVWQLDLGKIAGKRDQKSYSTKGDADAALAIKKAELKRGGEVAFSMTDEERLIYVKLRDKLAVSGATIDQAVDFYLLHARPAKGAITIRSLIDECAAAKEEVKCSPRYVSQLKCSANSFAEDFGEERMSDEVSAADVKRWLKANDWAPKTWNVYRGDLRTIYQWAIEAGHATMNPCEDVPTMRLEDGEVEFLSVDQAEKLLRRAAAVRPGKLEMKRDAKGAWLPQDLEELDFRDCLAFVVLGLFCGLRPERELGKKTWENVKEDVVIVQGNLAKSRSRRPVDLTENAQAWLDLCPSKEGRIVPPNFQRKWRYLRQAVGLLDDWPHDGVRHTFATMHMAHFQDEKKLQLLMGHESAELIYKHYRGLTKRAEAAKFWALKP